MMTLIEGDRRRDVRVPLNRPCKIHDPATGKYISASTHDVSRSGALIELPRLMNLRPGDTLHLGVAMKRREGLLRSDEMIRVAVMRTVQTVDDRTMVGLRFDPASVQAEPVPALAAA